MVAKGKSGEWWRWVGREKIGWLEMVREEEGE